MPEHENHHSEHQPLHHDEDTVEAFAERVKQLYAFERTALDELLELSRDPARVGEFESLLEDLTFTALSENEEYQANSKVIREHRVSKELQEEARDRQRELALKYKELVLDQAGISTERAKSEMQLAKDEIRSIVETELAKNPDTHPNDILHSLHILSTDDEGMDIFTYPQGLFPEATDIKWLTYLETVRSWLKIQDDVKNNTRAASELEDIDKTRRSAHNAVTRDVNELLGLDKLPEGTWDFATTRNLLAKMRDTRFPTRETGEKFKTERAVIQGVMGEHVLKALRLKPSDLHKEH